MTQSEEMSTSAEPTHHRKLRVRLIIAAVLVLIVAALILTPPYVNVNRYRRRITTTMSESLGRPVHLDNVSLHLLPVPSLTLSNLVVSEDPAFGYEPTIRANTVEATLRASSLWRRHVEFSTIRFIDPSVNLVRSAQGRWNLEDVLMQASHVETAPTEQRSAGAAPRFPYIEATGARVNVKLGNEKMPYSLTDAQFALWLPSPQIWRVRMRGRPTRTDSNFSQTGEMTLEGSLQRAQKMADVPIDLRTSWNGAPLGEASRLLTGNDAGWRGTVFMESHVVGQLSQAALTTHLQLNDLRRADFVPAQPLDITVDCNSTTDVARATLTKAQCAVPVGDAKPLTLAAESVDLEKPKSAEAKIIATDVPLPWVFGWAKLFAQDMPSTLEPAGNVNGELSWNSLASSWQGSMIATLPAAPNTDTGTPAKSQLPETPAFAFAIDTVPPAANTTSPAPIARLAPVMLHAAPGSVFTLSGLADANGYGLQLSGTATNAQALALANTLPPLNQGVGAALASEKNSTPHALSISCSRLWGGTQMCVPLPQAPAAKPTRTRHHR